LKCDAARSYVHKFHNGSYFSPKDPIWKLTRTNETVRTGTSYEIHKLHNISVSSVIDFILPLFVPTVKIPGVDIISYTICETTKNIIKCYIKNMNDSSSKAILAEQGIVSAYTISLEHNGQVLGFVGIDFCHEETIDQKEVAKILCEVAGAISYATYGKEKNTNNRK
jgi:hypothetical protein